MVTACRLGCRVLLLLRCPQNLLHLPCTQQQGAALSFPPCPLQQILLSNWDARSSRPLSIIARMTGMQSLSTKGLLNSQVGGSS